MASELTLKGQMAKNNNWSVRGIEAANHYLFLALFDRLHYS
jgi:hypothetical protein